MTGQLEIQVRRTVVARFENTAMQRQGHRWLYASGQERWRERGAEAERPYPSLHERQIV